MPSPNAVSGLRWRVWATVALVLAGFCGRAAAAEDSFPIGDAFATIQSMSSSMTANIETALASAQVKRVVHVLFTTLALSFFVWKFIGFALRGFDLLDVLEVMLTISFVYILLTSYQTIFPAIFAGGLYIGDAIGQGIIGASANTSLAQAMMGMFSRMTFSPVCANPIDCLGAGVMPWMAAIVGSLAVIVLGIVAMLVELWCIWGFAIAYAIGWVTIPFMMYERLSFLFEGWLKFFFGMTVYAIVAKANLALVFLGFELLLQVPPSVDGPVPTAVPVHGLFDLLGLLFFVAVGIFSLAATGRFASAIVMGAGGGGVGGIVQSAARAAANVASGGAGAAAGAVMR